MTSTKIWENNFIIGTTDDSDKIRTKLLSIFNADELLLDVRNGYKHV